MASFNSLLALALLATSAIGAPSIDTTWTESLPVVDASSVACLGSDGSPASVNLVKSAIANGNYATIPAFFRTFHRGCNLVDSLPQLWRLRRSHLPRQVCDCQGNYASISAPFGGLPLSYCGTTVFYENDDASTGCFTAILIDVSSDFGVTANNLGLEPAAFEESDSTHEGGFLTDFDSIP